MTIILKGRVPSKKNSKRIKYIRGRSVLLSSQEYLDWENTQLWLLPKIKEPIEKCSLSARFYFPDKRNADISNKIESVNDLLVKGRILKDDNWNVINELHLFAMGVDKDNPRVEIEII